MHNLKVDLCVIGAGSGGLSLASVAQQMGLSVALIEKHKMGGDCLNYGCVPSKAILAAAKRANVMRHANAFGISDVDPKVNYANVRDHIQGVINTIAPHDSVERFEKLGVKVILAAAKFINERECEAGDYRIQAKRFVIATGSRAAVPPIPGIDTTPFYTNETIFDLSEQPQRLIVVGGGPIGCELSQAHCLLGTPTTTLEMFSILPKDDPECVDVVRQQLIKNGLDLHEGIKVISVGKIDNEINVIIEKNGQQQQIKGSHLLIAAGRKPNLEELNLENAAVKFTPKGIEVDARLRTTNKRIFAIGDVAGSFQFTHAANYHAGIVIRNVLFHLPAKVNYQALPWVTYTEPELAQVGLNETMAQQQDKVYQTLHFPFKEIDRSVAEHETEGFAKILLTKRGAILGASIVGEQAGELILPWALAIQNKLKISAMASVIAPYPTRSEISKRVAGSFYTPSLYSARTKKIVRLLAKF